MPLPLLPRTHSKEITLLNPFCSFYLSLSLIFPKVVECVSDHVCVCERAAGNRITLITWQVLCPLRCWDQCVCVCVFIATTGAPCCRCAYRPDCARQNRLPSSQNQWLLFSLLQWPDSICVEYKACIVAHETVVRFISPRPLTVAGAYIYIRSSRRLHWITSQLHT